jgi:dCTP deaminase
MVGKSTKHPLNGSRTTVPAPHNAVLSKKEVAERLNKDIHIIPILSKAQVTEGSLDLRLGTHFVVAKAANLTHFEPAKMADRYVQDIQSAATKSIGETFVLHPGRLVLGSTVEYVSLPQDIAGLVLSRSSYGRIGLMVATAIFVHPRWKGCLTLELVNYSEVPLALNAGTRIAQLVLLRAGALGHTLIASPSRSLCLIRPEFSRLSTDKDWRPLGRLRALAGGM